MMELFAEIVNVKEPLFIFDKTSIIDILKRSQDTSMTLKSIELTILASLHSTTL